MKKIATSLLMAFLGGFAAIAINNYFDNQQTGFDRLTKERIPVHFAGNHEGNPSNVPNFIDAANVSLNGVVHVKTLVDNRRGGNDPFF